MKINNIQNKQNINKISYNKPIFKPSVKSLPTFKGFESISSDLYVKTQSNIEKILSNHQEKIKSFTKINKDALLRILFNFKQDFALADISSFLGNDENPDCAKLEKLLIRLKNEDVFSLYLEPILKIGKKDINSDTDFSKINKFLDFRLKAIENKALLNKHNFIATIADIDDIVLRNVLAVNKTLDLIGEKALIFSFKEKKDNVLAFIKDLGTSEWDCEIYTDLLKLTNPKSTLYYTFLKNEISHHKECFSKINDPEKLEQIKKTINTLTKEKRNLLEKSIKDPKEILEKALIILALNNNGLKEEAKELLAILNSKTEEDKELYSSMLNEILFEYYDFEKLPDEKTLEKLNFQNNKYLPRLFYTKQDFKKEFKKLIQLLVDNPDKTNLEIFNELPKNIQTRLEFQSCGLDYDKWVSYDSNSQIEYRTDENNTIIAKKVDMNNIPKALFLGDESDCCTRVNGSFARTSVKYITSKMIQAIEIYHNNLPVANTMCYLAKINNQIVLILDNIEVKPQYSKDETVKKAIFDYAEQMVKELGEDKIPIMLSNKRNDVQTSNHQSYYYCMGIIGSTLEDSIYLDFFTKEMPINNSTRYINKIELIPISKNSPVGRKSSDINMNNIIIMPNNLEQYINYYTDIIERNYDNQYD